MKHILMFCLYFHMHQDLNYDLYGIVEHSGLPDFGHYVCTIRSSPSSWHLMNDSLVSVRFVLQVCVAGLVSNKQIGVAG